MTDKTSVKSDEWLRANLENKFSRSRHKCRYIKKQKKFMEASFQHLSVFDVPASIASHMYLENRI